MPTKDLHTRRHLWIIVLVFVTFSQKCILESTEPSTTTTTTTSASTRLTTAPTTTTSTQTTTMRTTASTQTTTAPTTTTSTQTTTTPTTTASTQTTTTPTTTSTQTTTIPTTTASTQTTTTPTTTASTQTTTTPTTTASIQTTTTPTTTASIQTTTTPTTTASTQTTTTLTTTASTQTTTTLTTTASTQTTTPTTTASTQTTTPTTTASTQTTTTPTTTASTQTTTTPTTTTSTQTTTPAITTTSTQTTTPATTSTPTKTTTTPTKTTSTKTKANPTTTTSTQKITALTTTTSTQTTTTPTKTTSTQTKTNPTNIKSTKATTSTTTSTQTTANPTTTASTQTTTPTTTTSIQTTTTTPASTTSISTKSFTFTTTTSNKSSTNMTTTSISTKSSTSPTNKASKTTKSPVGPTTPLSAATMTSVITSPKVSAHQTNTAKTSTKLSVNPTTLKSTKPTTPKVTEEQKVNLNFSLSVTREFHPQLNNTATNLYKNYSTTFYTQIKNALHNTPLYHDIEITGFRNGSTICDYIAIYYAMKKAKRELILESIAESLMRMPELLKAVNFTVSPGYNTTLLKQVIKAYHEISFGSIDTENKRPYNVDCKMVDGIIDCERKCRTNYCEHSGQCIIDYELDSVECRCIETEELIYHGERCEQISEKLTMKKTYIVLIAVLCGSILFCVIIILTVFLCKMKRRAGKRTKDSEEGDHLALEIKNTDVRQSNLYRGFNAKGSSDRSRTENGFDNGNQWEIYRGRRLYESLSTTSESPYQSQDLMLNKGRKSWNMDTPVYQDINTDIQEDSTKVQYKIKRPSVALGTTSAPRPYKGYDNDAYNMDRLEYSQQPRRVSNPYERNWN